MRYTLDKSNVRNGLFNVLDNGKPTEAFAAEHVIFNNRCIVTGGEFRGGWFRGGEFHGGEFHGGWFRGGEFHGGEFHGGVFHGGWFRGGWFRGGEFHGYTPEQVIEYKRYIDLAAEVIRAAS